MGSDDPAAATAAAAPAEQGIQPAPASTAQGKQQRAQEEASEPLPEWPPQARVGTCVLSKYCMLE